MEEREYGLAVGRKIRDARTRAGLTQQDLGDEVNLSRTSITNIENGNQPVTAWMLNRIGGATGSSPADLLPSPADEQRPNWPTDVPPHAAALIRRLDSAAK